MIEVHFHNLDSIPNNGLIFAVICTTHKSLWVWCKNKGRGTWEIPGGKREIGEGINQTAARELKEETGASKFELAAVCEYSVTTEGQTKYGRLFYAEVEAFDKIQIPDEIEKIQYFSELPQDLSFPQIQPILLKKVITWKESKQ
jgi:8-oxo-dGTP diphosphatase